MQALMALHARELIAEMEEDYQNPAAAWIEGLLAKRAASKLVRRHGSRLIREILIALSEVPDFPAVRHLWNAAHPDVPIHCFLRIRREPVFRLIDVRHRPEEIEVIVEHCQGARGKGTRRIFVLKRDGLWRLVVESGR